MTETPTTPQERLSALAGLQPGISTAPVDHPKTAPDDVVQPPALDGAMAAQAAEMPTSALPATPTPLTPAQRRAAARGAAGARVLLKKMVQGEAPPTTSMSIIDRLVGSPYAKVTRNAPSLETASISSYEGARKTLDLALDIAETMFRYGAGALEVETSIIAVTAAYGLKHIDIDVTYQSVAINHSPEGQAPIQLLRVVRSWTSNYAGLILVHDLVQKIIDGGVSRSDAIRELKTLQRRPKPFPRWAVTVGGAVFCGSITVMIGGTFLEALITTLSVLLTTFGARQLGKWRVPDFYTTAFVAFLVTMSALVANLLHQDFRPSLITAGAIVLLLPGGRLVGAVQDAINGFPVTAAGRMVSAMLTFGAIVVGIAIAVTGANVLGFKQLDIAHAPPAVTFSWWAMAVVVLIAGLLNCVFEQTALDLLLPTALVAVVGYFAYYVVSLNGFGPRLTPAIAATVVGFFGRVVALRLGAPQLVVTVPAVIYLMPGLAVFRSMYTLALDTSTFEGIAGLAGAFMIILGVAGGTVAGDNLARPFTVKMSSSLDRRRGRRR